MHVVAACHGAEFAVGEEAGQRERAAHGLDQGDVVVGFAVKALAAADAGDQERAARRGSDLRENAEQGLQVGVGRVRVAQLKLQRLTATQAGSDHERARVLIEAEQIAVGAHARAIKILTDSGEALGQKGWAEIQNKLKELVEAISEHGGSLENRDALLDSTETVTKELCKDKPNKLTIGAILEGIAEGVKSVTNIAAVAQGLKTAIEALL